MTWDNLIKKYERDMLKHEKKMAKMREMDKKGIDYNIDEIEVSEDESEEPLAQKGREEEKKDEYNDEPYKAQKEESTNFEKQY